MKIFLKLILVLGFIFFFHLSWIPDGYTHDIDLYGISIKTQGQIRTTLITQLKNFKSFIPITDQVKQNRVKNIGERLLSSALGSRTLNEWKALGGWSFSAGKLFTLLHEKEPDTISFPGCILVDYRIADFPDEILAFYLAHELYHAIIWDQFLEQWLNSESDKLKEKMKNQIDAVTIPGGLLVVSTPVHIISFFAGELFKGVGSALIAKFERDFNIENEKKADNYARDLMQKAGYDFNKVPESIRNRQKNHHPLRDQRKIIVSEWVKIAEVFGRETVLKAVPYRDGDLLRGPDQKIYIIEGGKKRLIPDNETFNAKGYKWDQIRNVDPTTFNSIPMGTPLASVKQPLPNYEEIVRRAYIDILKREPDPGERDRYIARLKAGMTESGLRAELQYSEEYKRKFTELKEKVEELLPTLKKFPPPVITNIEPSSGAPGIEIKIYGNHFAPQGLSVPPYVRFERPGSTPLNARVISFRDNEIKAIVPPWKGNVNVYVETIGPQKSNKHIFNYLLPDIKGISPESGKRDQIVRIVGENFGTQHSLDLGHFLKFGNTIITPAKAIRWDDKQVEVRAPKDFGTGIDQDIFLSLLGCFGGKGISSELAKLVLDFTLPGCEDLFKNLVERYKLSVKPGFLERKVQVTIETSVGKSNEKPFTFQIITEIKHSTDPARPKIISNLRILETPPYKIGQIITAEFSIGNFGASSIVFDVLTVGGRLNGTCPQNRCPDFEFKPNVTLPPNGSYTYRGTLKLEASGNYHFFTAYRSKDGQWNTAIPTTPGVTNTKDIVVDPPTLPCTDGAQFVDDVTVRDNTQMQPNQGFTKTWRLRNTGSCAWGSGYSLVFVGGSQMGAPGLVSVPSTPQNGTADISVPMQAPSSPGTHQGYWQMRNQKGQNFGPQISVKINVASAPSTGCIATVSSDRWKGEYFNNKSLSGTPLMVRDDGTGYLNFDWGTGSPSSTCGIPSDNFSARWTRTFYFEGGTYRFSVTADDGVRFYVDGSLKVDRWFDQPAATHAVDVPLSAGNHTLRMEYYETGGQAVAKLSWQKVTTDKPPVSPTISMSPPSGSVGTTFNETGSGFTPNNTATLYGRRPDGSVWQITTVNLSSTGGFSRTWTAQTAGNNFAWWAVDNATGKKSNEIVFNVTSAITTVDNPPNVTSFSASASQINQGGSVTLSYSVVDDVGLRQVELWRADDTAGVGFREIKRVSISGKSNSGSISDTPPTAGTYRYGVHVVDTKGQWNCERNSQSGFSPGVYGPRQVVVAGAPTVTPPIAPTISMSPPSGPVGTTFTQTGRGFTPNRAATIYGRNPDGTVVQVTTVNTDSAGSFTSIWTAQTAGNNLGRWAVDNHTGQKSNEIVFNVTTAIPTVDRSPNITSFSASASQITQGQSITLSYSVSDDVGLSYVRLVRADDSAKVDFREIRRFSVSGGSYSGSFTDTPPSAGTYRYGVHVVDTKGQWNCERNSQSGFSPGVYGPRQVVVAGAPTVDQPPNVTSFSVSSSQINQGQSVTLSYSVADDVGLSYVRLVRADDSAKIDFREIRRVSVSGKQSSGTFSDTPPSPGTHRYGIHVVDTANKWNCERNSQTGSSPGVYGPRQVVVASAPPPCTDGAQFVADVTVPDNTQMQPNQTFTKTWRLKNTGSCVWGSGYSLVFVGGSQMRAPGSVSVPSTPQNGTADISVPMAAPSAPGPYRGNWQMRNQKGQPFGPQIWVKINVASAPPPPPPSPPCTDGAQFVADVTIPDNTQMQPNQGFTKTWRLRNTGSCTWGSGYSLVFVGGTQMGAPGSVSVPSVAPNGTADISVPMIAPSSAGAYQGNWQMRNPKGQTFGQQVWVKINVASAPPPPPPPPPCTDGAQFVADVTIPDGTQMQPNQGFTKTWKLRNTGGCTWGSGYSLVFVGGSQMGAPGSVSVPSVAPNGTADISVPMIAPSSAGAYQGNWQMRNPKGQTFGQQVWVKINVASAPVVNPQIQVSISPSGPWGTSASGQKNTVFYIRGSGFSPNAVVQYNVRKPDGSMYPPGDYTGKVDGAGNFNHTYTSQCTTVVGTYTVWVIDKPSGKSSNTITEQITKNPNCK